MRKHFVVCDCHGNYSDSNRQKEFWVFNVQEEAQRIVMDKSDWPINIQCLQDSVRNALLPLTGLSGLADAASGKGDDVEICDSGRWQGQFKGSHLCPAAISYETSAGGTGAESCHRKDLGKSLGGNQIYNRTC